MHACDAECACVLMAYRVRSSCAPACPHACMQMLKQYEVRLPVSDDLVDVLPSAASGRLQRPQPGFKMHGGRRGGPRS